MKIKFKIKSIDAIAPLLETSEMEGEEGLQYTNGIEWDPALAGKTLTLQGIETEYDYVDIIVVSSDGNKSYITHDWIEKSMLGKKPFTLDIKTTNENYLKVNSSWYDIKASRIVKNVPSCKCCGVPTTNDDFCDECIPKLTFINHYNFKPDYNFYGTQLKADAKNPVWYGIELEYALDSNKKMASLIHKSNEALYLKSDSSISGGAFQAELVSHPHSFKALTGAKSPLATLGTLDVAEEASGCGCHIHISRTAFKSNKHYSLFYFLVNSNKDLLEFIGNRELTGHCKLETSGRVFTKENTRDANTDRTRVINEQNSDTIEVRFFNSTNTFTQVKMYLQFLESLIKYTNYHLDTVSFSGWIAYINKYKKKYLELQHKLDKYGKDLPNEIVFRPPVVEVFNFSKLSMKDIQNLISITTKGKEHKLHNSPELHIYPTYLEFRDTSGNYLRHYFVDISDAKIEKE